MLKRLLSNFDSDVQELIKGSSIAFAIRFVGIVALYGLTLYITNTFGSAAYGEFSFFVLSTKLVSILAVAGIDIYLLRYISEDDSTQKISSLVNNSTVTVLANGLFLLSALSILLSLKPNLFFENKNYNYFLYFGIIPFSLLRINTQSFRATRKSFAFSLLEYLLIPIFAFIGIYLISKFTKQGNATPIIAYIISITLLSFTTLFYWQGKYLNFHKIDFSKSIKSILKTNKLALPFLISGSIIVIGQWTVSLILKSIEGNDALGVFDAALKISTVLMMPLVAASVIIAPMISRHFSSGNYNKIKKVTTNVTKISILLTIPILLIFYFFSESLMAYFGEEFQGSGYILRIILWGLLFNVITGPVAVLLQMTENQKIVQNVFLGSTCLNIILTYLLVSKMGLLGAAIANLIYQIIINGILLIFTHRKFKFITFIK